MSNAQTNSVPTGVAHLGDGPARAAGTHRRAVSVIVPTYREAVNIKPLTGAIAEVRERHSLDLDLWLMDDQSRDGIAEVVEGLNLDWVHLIERTGERGLSQAVLDGFIASGGRRLVVMDADLSHPASAIPGLLRALDEGAEFAFGARYVTGGGTARGWGITRILNSRCATLLARPLTDLRDPLSGFFAFDRSRLHAIGPLDPVGYKIGLELIVKSRATRIVEVPIQFAERLAGKSKLTFRQQLLFIEHLRRLYLFRFFGPRPTR